MPPGIGGGGGFVTGRREGWERTFAVNLWGACYCARTFMPLVIASGEGVLVNTGRVNGFWATLGPGMPNAAYATAKFAINCPGRSERRHACARWRSGTLYGRPS